MERRQQLLSVRVARRAQHPRIHQRPLALLVHKKHRDGDGQQAWNGLPPLGEAAAGQCGSEVSGGSGQRAAAAAVQAPPSNLSLLA